MTRDEVLKKVAAGEMSAEEAASLLDELDKKRKDGRPSVEEDDEDEDEDDDEEYWDEDEEEEGGLCDEDFYDVVSGRDIRDELAERRKSSPPKSQNDEPTFPPVPDIAKHRKQKDENFTYGCLLFVGVLILFLWWGATSENGFFGGEPQEGPDATDYIHPSFPHY